MVMENVYSVYPKLLIEDLAHEIRSFKLNESDQKKPGEEIQKIVESAHKEIVKRHLEMCLKISKK